MKSTSIESQRFFVTGLSLITSYGPCGKNVMAAEWTMQISYEPMLIAVFIHKGSSTLKNIKKTKRFGVNVASEEQSTLISVAGGYSRKEIDKLEIHNLFRLKSIRKDLPLIADCIINAECKLYAIKKIGDHTMVVGKVLSIIHDKTKKPLLYHQNRYFRIGSMVEQARDKVTADKKLFDIFHKRNQGKFIMKCVGVLVRSKKRVLITRDIEQNTIKTIPYIQAPKNKNNREELVRYLKNRKLNITLENKPKVKRLLVANKNQVQRINFVLFSGLMKGKPQNSDWVSVKNDRFLRTLIK